MNEKNKTLPRRADRIWKSSTVLVYAVLAAMLLISEVISPGFLKRQHMNTILTQAGFLGIVAIGQTLIIMTGGIDLSIASVITLTNLVAAQIMNGKDANILQALFIALAIGLAAGAVNGICVHYLRVPAIIMTLATGSVIEGIGYLYSKGMPSGYTAPLLNRFSTGRMFDLIPYVVVLWALLAVTVLILLYRTPFGRSIYAVGANAVTARYSGINIAATTILVYAISGVCAAIVGVLYVGYTKTSFLDVGSAFTMTSVAAVVVGGTSPSGGEGGYAGTIAGAIIMTVLTALLTVINIQESGRSIMEGVIILLLVYLYSRKTVRKKH